MHSVLNAYLPQTGSFHRNTITRKYLFNMEDLRESS